MHFLKRSRRQFEETPTGNNWATGAACVNYHRLGDSECIVSGEHSGQNQNFKTGDHWKMSMQPSILQAGEQREIIQHLQKDIQKVDLVQWG